MPVFVEKLLEFQILGNPVKVYALVVLLVLCGIVAISLFKRIVLVRVRNWVTRTPNKTDDFILILCEKYLLPLLYLGVFYFSLNQIALNPVSQKYANAIAVIVLTVQLSRLVLSILSYFFEQSALLRESRGKGNPISTSVLTILRVVIWGMALVFIFDNLGFNVSAVVAGLGIGGVAVALAAQTILGDLFNYFVIFFDRPFEEGDFIIVEDMLGVIEKIGIKSTRIRSLGGEQIVISNSNLTASRIRNYKRMQQRRALFEFGVIYETPVEKLRRIPDILREILGEIREAYLDRAHFKKFGAYSLDFEVVYYIMSAEYNKYMDVQQHINLAMVEAFQREGIEFAYPTQLEYIRAQIQNPDADAEKTILADRMKMPAQAPKNVPPAGLMGGEE